MVTKKEFFTLIEQIAVIAILATILFPAFAQAYEKAQQANCRSNLMQIGLAERQYAENYDERSSGSYQTYALANNMSVIDQKAQAVLIMDGRRNNGSHYGHINLWETSDTDIAAMFYGNTRYGRPESNAVSLSVRHHRSSD